MAVQMNLSGDRRSFFIPPELCQRLQRILMDNWCADVTEALAYGGDGKITGALYSVRDKVVLKLSAPTGTNSLVVSKTILSQKGKGTYTELFRDLMAATDKADAKLVIPCVSSPGLVEWCHRFGFVKSTEDNSYFHVKV